MPGPMTGELLNSQQVCELVLRLMYKWTTQRLGYHATLRDLEDALCRRARGVTSADLNASLHYLAESQMLALKWRKKRKQWEMRILARGMDFLIASFPWQDVNEFHPLKASNK